MFGIFASEQSRARHDARNWLHLADKVFHFRRDQLPPAEIQGLQQAQHELKTRLAEKADAARLKMGIERLEGCLRRSGGAYYPKSSMVENVEFFLVAMILFLGIRAFFFQPFKIPTNSMWPSYYGMTAEIFADESDEPGKAAELFRFLTLGASPHRAIAPESGRVYVAVRPESYQLLEEPVRIRKWLVFPADGRRATFVIGGEQVKVTYPAEFSNEFARVVTRAFFGGRPDGFALAVESQVAQVRNANQPRAEMPHDRIVFADGRSTEAWLIDTGRQAAAGEHFLSFDILTGDQLFVDRISYNFVRPKVGDGFVFRTRNIPDIGADQYYIKRLVGVPGDTLEVRGSTLFRNGAPISGSDIFEKNANRIGKYPGYTTAYDPRRVIPYPLNHPVTVPENSFFAMGDNSPDSADSRYWGFVPAGEVVGRPLFIYFPFTRRWGHSP